MMAMEVPGKRMRGNPKQRWFDSIVNYLSEKALSEKEANDRAKWRRLVRTIDPTQSGTRVKDWQNRAYFYTHIGYNRIMIYLAPNDPHNRW